MTFFAPHDIIIKLILILVLALVAQLDRVTGYEPVGRGFESLQARHPPTQSVGGFLLSNQAPPSWGGTVAVLHPLFYGKFAPQTSILLNFVPFPILSLFQLHSKRANPPRKTRGVFLLSNQAPPSWGGTVAVPSPPFLWEVCTANFYRPACFQYQKSTQKCGFLLTSRTKYRRFFFSRRAKTPRKIWGFFPFKR